MPVSSPPSLPLDRMLASDPHALSINLHSSPATLDATLRQCTVFSRLVRSGAAVYAAQHTIDELWDHHPLLWRLCGGSCDGRRHEITRDNTLQPGLVVAKSNMLRFPATLTASNKKEITT